MLRQAFAFAELTVVTGHIAFDQVTHFRRLRLPESSHGLWGIEPGKKQVAGEVIALFEGHLLWAKVPRTLAVDGNHFIGQQAQVVLGVGIANAIAQPALIGRANMRHPKRGATNLGTHLAGRCLSPCGQTQAQA